MNRLPLLMGVGTVLLIGSLAAGEKGSDPPEKPDQKKAADEATKVTQPEDGTAVKPQSPPAGSPGSSVPQDLTEALSTSSVGLREVPSPVPNGGTMVDLQGRFRNMWIATGDGNLEIQCIDPGSAPPKRAGPEDKAADRKSEKE